MTTKIEKEAKDFMTEKKQVVGLDKTVVRYYTGCALTALIQNSGGHRQYEEDIVENAFHWGIRMAEKEKQRT